MKVIRLFATALTALLLASACVKEFDDAIIDKGLTTLTISLSDTRTVLGEKSGDYYPLYWSDGDKICINGVCSNEADIASENRAIASFSFSSSVRRPYHITYPYIASTTTDTPKVLFPAEQQYREGSFAEGCAPMCGYTTEVDTKIVLKHLAGVLRIPIKTGDDVVSLKKIVITSTGNSKLSGIFNVDCVNAIATPSDVCSNAITYTFPDNFTLSTSETYIYISVPAGEIGDCNFEIFDSTNKSMVYRWSPSSDVKPGIVREFKPITYIANSEGVLEPFTDEDAEFEIRYKSVFGYVKDNSGKPIKGVPVSDGFTIVTTDANGYYSMDVSSNTWYIYITLPAEYEVPINENGQVCFWKKYPSSSQQYDFTLTPLPGGKEKKFALFTFGDPQVSSESSLSRFYNEAVPAIKAHYNEVSKTMPCYGITLGDIIANGTSSDRGYLRIPMRDGFTVQKVGLPVFHVMGNHDCNFYNSHKPAFPDEYNSTYNIKVQRDHETVFGPVNYSFNRGDIHIIGMRNIYYTKNSSQSIKLGFLKEQYEWLKQDLALVPKDNTILFCVHIPMMKGNTEALTPEVMNLLNTYPNTHIISGHRHFVWNYDYAAEGTAYTNLKEHVMGAICGAWWKTNLCGCGAPCGYGVFVGEGKEITDSYHIGIHEGMNVRSHQMRLYRGNAITGAAIPEGAKNSNGTLGYYAFNFDEDILLANVYFADNTWTVKVYEDGEFSGNMTLVPMVRRPTLPNLAGDGSWDTPFISKIATSHDMYVAGLMLGILGLEDGTGGGRDECYHMYQYKLKNKNAEIKVEAIDGFGNVYTETKITEGSDYSITKAK